MVSKNRALDVGLKAVADATRRDILSLLRVRERSVQEIAEEFPVSRPAISKHLRILKEAGLVIETPAGRQRVYSLDREPLGSLVAWLSGFNGRIGPTVSASVGARAFRRRVASGPADWRVW